MDPIICKNVKGYSYETFCYDKTSGNFKRKHDDQQFPVCFVNIRVQMLFFLYCIPSSSDSKGDLSFWQFWKIINVSWILERYIGMVGEGLLRGRISSIQYIQS